MSGDVRVARVYKRPAAYREWLWAINRPYAEWSDLQLAGRAASLEQAKCELMENWKKVLSAELTKRALIVSGALRQAARVLFHGAGSAS
jgi:hypothetical protein